MDDSKEQFVKHTGPIVIAALAMIGPSKNAEAEQTKPARPIAFQRPDEVR